MRWDVEVEEIRSGEDDAVLWVSLGFESELAKNDVLFIVCGKSVDEQDRELGMDGLYFERFNQINSCYNAAERISVTEDAISISLTEEGRGELKLPELVRFGCSLVSTEFREARKVFEKMMRYDWAKAVQSA